MSTSNANGSPYGTAAVLDRETDRVSIFDVDGHFVGRCRPVLNGAHGLWRDPAGHILLAEDYPSRPLPC